MYRSFAIILAALSVAPACWGSEPHCNPISDSGVLAFATVRSVMVPNNALNATLVAEATGQAATQLARQVNQTVARAREAVGKDQTIRLHTLGYTTQPVFESNQGNQGNRRTGWTVRQTVQLETQDFDLASKRLAELQAFGLKLEGLEFGLTPTVRERHRLALKETALRAWMAQADMAVKTIGAKGWRPGRISLYDGYPPTGGGEGLSLARGMGSGGIEEELPLLMLDPGESSVVASVQGEAVIVNAPGTGISEPSVELPNQPREFQP